MNCFHLSHGTYATFPFEFFLPFLCFLSLGEMSSVTNYSPCKSVRTSEHGISISSRLRLSNCLVEFALCSSSGSACAPSSLELSRRSCAPRQHCRSDPNRAGPLPEGGTSRPNDPVCVRAWRWFLCCMRDT